MYFYKLQVNLMKRNHIQHSSFAQNIETFPLQKTQNESRIDKVDIIKCYMSELYKCFVNRCKVKYLVN